MFEVGEGDKSLQLQRFLQLGVSMYGRCNLLPWPHLQSSCLLAAYLRHVHADEQGPWASLFECFSESVEWPLLCPKFL